MKDYHNLHLKCDFYNQLMCLKNLEQLKNYRLCPSHYLSAPGLSWDVMLKMTKIKLELIPDLEIFISFD